MVDEVSDLKKRYNGAHIARKATSSGGDVKPVYVETFYTNDDGAIVLRIHNRDSERYDDELWDEDNFILGCPKVGMIFDGEKAYYMRRVPDRQWKGGYNKNVIRMGVLSGTEARELGLKSKVQSDPDIINFAYNPKYLTIDEGISSMKKGKIFSFPISRNFAVSQQVKSEYPVVFYKDWIVGWYKEEQVHLPNNTQHLIEELSQYVACRRV